jgi:hypothetical protein
MAGFQIYDLLSFSSSSAGFTKFSSETKVTDRSASPPRKIRRLEGDSDSASSSRNPGDLGPNGIKLEIDSKDGKTVQLGIYAVF